MNKRLFNKSNLSFRKAIILVLVAAIGAVTVAFGAFMLTEAAEANVVSGSGPVWSMSGRDQYRRGRGVGSVSSTPPAAPAWSRDLAAPIVGDIVVSAEDKIYFAADKVYALNPDGANFVNPVSLPGSPTGSPAIDEVNGFIYFSFITDSVPTHNPFIVVRYDKQLSNPTTIFEGVAAYNGGVHPLIIAENGTLLIPYGRHPQRLAAIGTTSWNIQLCDAEPAGSPAVRENSIYAFCNPAWPNLGGRKKISLTNGEIIDFPSNDSWWREPIVDAGGNIVSGYQGGGTVYVGFYARWNSEFSSPISLEGPDNAYTTSRSALMPDGASTVRIGYGDFSNRVLRHVGPTSWGISSNDPSGIEIFQSAPSVDASGRILIGKGKRLQAIDSTGTVLWDSPDLGGKILNQPSIARSGAVYVATENNRFIAIGGPTGGPTPTLDSINPSSPIASNIDQNITANGANFQQGLTATVTFPNGQTATLSGTQIQEVTNTSFKMRITLGSPGNWSIRVNNPDGSQSNNLPFTVQSNAQPPVIFSITPSSPGIWVGRQDILAHGANFQPGMTLELLRFDNSQWDPVPGWPPHNVTSDSFLFLPALGVARDYTIRVRNPDNQVSPPFQFNVTIPTPQVRVNSINPSTPTASGADQDLYVIGENFQNGLKVSALFPSGVGAAVLQGTGQIRNLTPTSFTLRITLNETGTWQLVLRNPNNSTFGVYVTVQPGAPPPAGLPTSVLSPVIGPLRVTTTNQDINDGKWEFNQHGTGLHTPIGGISRSNDTKAWDINLYEPLSGNADVGRPVFAVADGEVVSFVGNPPGGLLGAVLIAHPNASAPVWFSGYLHMTDIRVSIGQVVNTTTLIGSVGREGATNDHLHFAVYSGANFRGNLASFNTQITERLTGTANIPTVDTVNPPSVIQGLARQTITINGTNFSPNAIVIVRDPNGREIQITPESVSVVETAQITGLSSSVITARVPFTYDGRYTVAVLNLPVSTGAQSGTLSQYGLSNARVVPSDPSALHSTPIVFIPGTMGSRLGRRRLIPIPTKFDEIFPSIPVWQDYRELRNGTLDETPVGQRSIVATSILAAYLGNSIPNRDLDFYGTTLSTFLGPYSGYRMYDDRGDPEKRTPSGCDTSQRDKNFFVFPYDWRRSNDLTARELKDFVDCIKMIRDPNNTNPNFKVDIVAHSQGGMVARRYILEAIWGTGQNYDPRVRKLITLGTPWVGATKFINVITTGEHESLNKIMSKGTVKDIARYMPGAHELIPSPVYADELKDAGPGDFPFGETYNYDVWNTTNGGLIERSYNSTSLALLMNRYNPPNTSIFPGTNTSTFHNKLYNGSRLMDDWRADQTPITYYNIVGRCYRAGATANFTLGSIIAKYVPATNSQGQIVSTPGFVQTMTRGDCTVPEISATRERTGLNYRGPAIQKIFENVGHGDLPKSRRVLDCVSKLLAGQNIDSCSNASTDHDDSLRKSGTSNAGAYYFDLSGSPMVRISDSFGNTTEPLSSLNLEDVPTIQTNVTGEDNLHAVIPLDQNYKIVLRTSDAPLVMEVRKSTGQVTTLAVRYIDTVIPPNVLAMIELGPQGVTTLMYDSNDDGTFDTPVTPTIVVDGPDAADIEPPNVIVNETVLAGTSRINLEATDAGTGVQRIMYSLNGTAFQQYSTPLTLNPTVTPTIYAFADDNVANRSGLVTHNLTTSNVGFSVTGPSSAPGGSQIIANWSAPAGRPVDDWVGLFRVNTLNSAYISKQYTGGTTSGSLPFTLPNLPGIYEFRYLLNDGFASVAVSNPINVISGSVFDFDGDGKTDVSVWRPADGNWHVLRSTDGYAAYAWGANGDRIVPADFDGDGKADVAVWRPADGTWHILNSNGGTYSSYTWGASGDVPVVGDYDDDGKADVAVYRSPGQWFILKSSGGTQTNTWGVAGDVPAAGDFDGDGQTDIAVRRPSTGEWFINRSTAGYIAVTWGVGTDTPVHADYDGDQKDDIAVWRPSTGEWFILRSTDGGFTQATWGASGDVPVPGDYDGDGRADISVVRNGVWHISQSTDGYRTTTWGVGTDIAIPGRY